MTHTRMQNKKLSRGHNNGKIKPTKLEDLSKT